ncbi:PREDICTED: translation initiation factor IF-2-like, partial [Chinchilla lanigera]|uniref:translation initiation factor IF-2-like n=1 Tax=Chinchilla lanigera TaxID=34839 RepID=UPI000697170E
MERTIFKASPAGAFVARACLGDPSSKHLIPAVRPWTSPFLLQERCSGLKCLLPELQPGRPTVVKNTRLSTFRTSTPSAWSAGGRALQGSQRRNVQNPPAPQLSRDLLPAPRDVIPSAAVAAAATARRYHRGGPYPSAVGAARPSLPGPPIPASPDLLLGRGPPRAPAAPPRRRRPPARPSVHLQRAGRQAGRQTGRQAGRQAAPPLPDREALAPPSRGVGSGSPAEGSAAAERRHRAPEEEVATAAAAAAL